MLTVEKIIKTLTDFNNNKFSFKCISTDKELINAYKAYKRASHASWNRPKEKMDSSLMNTFCKVLECLDIKYNG